MFSIGSFTLTTLRGIGIKNAGTKERTEISNDKARSVGENHYRSQSTNEGCFHGS